MIWYSKFLAVIVGIGIFVLGAYIGSFYQKSRTAMEIAEGLKGKVALTVEKKVEQVYAFNEKGNIKNIASGDVEEDEWVLIYEKPGAPALTKELVFTTSSSCVIDARAEFCNTAAFEQGQRVWVMGSINGEGIINVERLEMAGGAEM